jgi:hypothetical protein
MNHPDEVHHIYKIIDDPDYISTGACAESSGIVYGLQRCRICPRARPVVRGNFVFLRKFLLLLVGNFFILAADSTPLLVLHHQHVRDSH